MGYEQLQVENGESGKDYLARGISRDTVPVLAEVADRYGDLYPLLHSLTIGDAEAFQVKLAMLYTLGQSLFNARWDRQELNAQFRWLDPGRRDYLLGVLRNGGWIDLHDGHYFLSPLGRAVFGLLIAIHPTRFGDHSLDVTLEVPRLVEAAGGDTNTLRSLRNLAFQHFMADAQEIEDALHSRSQLALEEVVRRSDRHRTKQQILLDLTAKIREADPAPHESAASRQVHDGVSRFHTLLITAHRTLDRMYADQLISTGRITLHDLNAWLRAATPQELNELGDGLASPPSVFWPAHPDTLVATAEEALLHPHERPVPSRPGRPRKAPVRREVRRPANPYIEVEADLARFLADGQPRRLSAVVPAPRREDAVFRLLVLELLDQDERREALYRVPSRHRRPLGIRLNRDRTLEDIDHPVVRRITKTVIEPVRLPAEGGTRP